MTTKQTLALLALISFNTWLLVAADAPTWVTVLAALYVTIEVNKGRKARSTGDL